MAFGLFDYQYASLYSHNSKVGYFSLFAVKMANVAIYIFAHKLTAVFRLPAQPSPVLCPLLG
jgi:hypothetical protein